MADLKDPLSLANKLKADIEYLQTPDFTVVYNHERVNIKKFGKDTIKKESSSTNYMFDPKVPSWLHSKISVNLFEDESKLMNIGLTDDTTYLEWAIESSYPSSWKQYPERYKFSSI